MTTTWMIDVLGAPYESQAIDLPPDDEGEVVATLVRRRADAPTGRAVLHVHGFADYFFQTPAADYWTGRGYDFYALDLRKYGRSLLPHQTPNFTTDLAAYYPELDEAFRRVTEDDGHDHVLVSAHSTGGLVTPLWVHDHEVPVAGLVLNSPWLDLHGSLLLRTAGTKAIEQIGARRPYLAIPREVSGLYAQSLHVDHRGEWSFDVAWKPIESWPVYAGWLRAIRRGHARVHRGLELEVPVLVLTSGASGHPKEWDETCTGTDLVLDVLQIRKWAHKLATHVTLVKVEGALHDVTLSRPEVRARAFDEISRWHDAFLP
ncbi:alpha/beta hydrolase [Nocardioides mesophilus]|uniref:Alpha/beta hydrolase n=1 Tax=Nocardioides mesophilus TaxID=433659 RepID=A0A7G9RB83_9ACTN|nr:alpha/beta hydrolase [Nocardioides mesophilus]QNN52858.1 alpha/beta hydrolase [Nocardioides mesophilus]